MSIKINAKPCRGIGHAREFEGCGILTMKRTYGLCSSCYADWLLNTDAGKEKLERATLKATQPRRDLQKAAQEHKDQKSLGYLLVATRTACHDYIKLRDRGKPCVSCDGPWSKDHQAGHYKKAELYPTLKYHEMNIHNQCEGCNLYKDGNVQMYGDKIHNRIGREGKEEIERLAEEDKKINFKWDREELMKTRKYYQEKTKELKKILSLD